LINAIVSYELKNGPLKESIGSHFDILEEFAVGTPHFIACFCEEGDLLSQWRGYTPGLAGVSLGLDLFPIMVGNGLPAHTVLRKVVYEYDEQRQLIHDAVSAWVSSAFTLLDDPRYEVSDLFPTPAMAALRLALSEYQLCFKHPTFSEEREWRLMTFVNVDEGLRLLADRRRETSEAASRERIHMPGIEFPARPNTARTGGNFEAAAINFRSSSLGLIPYVELELRATAGVFSGGLPLNVVIQGPTTTPDLSLVSLRMYLESVGYGFYTEVTASGIPLRG
jgi:hypothetical protein